MDSNCAINSFKHLVFILRIFEVFNEMKIEINVINYKIFTKFKIILKIRVKAK